MTDIKYEPFVVNTTPHCFWDVDVRQRNLEFLSSIDAGYYFHLAEIHQQHLGGAEKQYAATSLRATYSHGLETLFALLCATVQAPKCVLGWILRYRNEDLPEVVRKISEGSDVLTYLAIGPITWDSLAALLCSRFSTGDSARDSRIKDGFAYLWQSFAADFLDHVTKDEYNSLKHGLRVHMGGFQMAAGIESVPGVPADPSTMESLGGSVFGSTFFQVEPLSKQKELKHNFYVIRNSLNWNPMKFVHGLILIGMSIQNVIGLLKSLNGVPLNEIQFAFPCMEAGDDSYFHAPWSCNVNGPRYSNLGARYTIEDSALISKAAVRQCYPSGDQPEASE